MVINKVKASADEIWKALESVTDPEIPVLSIRELGVLQKVTVSADTATIVVSPTYTGCPAMVTIRADIEHCLSTLGFAKTQVQTQLSPPWSTDWITTEGREKLRLFGIAPPQASWPSATIACPRCGSQQTQLVSEFGSTPCKALHRCEDCLESFDYFKCL